MNSKNNLLVCQNIPIINNQNAIYNCIDFNENPLKIDSDNYITVKYNKTTKYDSGFKIDSCTSRKDISYIIYQVSIIFGNESLIIDVNKSIEIFCEYY